MNKSEQVDLLLEALTRCDLKTYEEINENLLRSGVDFSKIPQEKLAFASNRFLADMNAKGCSLHAVQFITPKRFANRKIERETLTAKDVAAEIFCCISREYAGIYTFDKIHQTVQIIFDNGQKFMVSVERL